MYQLLDSQLEALAFNYVSFGFFTLVNNLWTWVAVLTAALSFWRIKTAVKNYDQNQKPSTISISGRASDDGSRPVPGADENTTTLASASVVETSIVERLVCNGAGKLKLTVYYEEYEGEQQSDVDLDGEMTVTEWSDGGCGCGEWWESWERVLTLRKGETKNGWCRYQDLTALNGNVVRLWG